MTAPVPPRRAPAGPGASRRFGARLDRAILFGAALAALPGAARAADMTLDLRATGGLSVSVQAAAPADDAHFCALATQPDGRRSLLLVFGKPPAATLLDATRPGLVLTVADAHSDGRPAGSAGDTIQVAVGGRRFLGLGLSDPAFRLDVTLDADGVGGHLHATHLEDESGAVAIDLSATWRCPVSAASAVTPLGAAATGAATRGAVTEGATPAQGTAQGTAPTPAPGAVAPAAVAPAAPPATAAPGTTTAPPAVVAAPSAPASTPVAPAPSAPAPSAPTPVEPTPVAPTPVAPGPASPSAAPSRAAPPASGPAAQAPPAVPSPQAPPPGAAAPQAAPPAPATLPPVPPTPAPAAPTPATPLAPAPVAPPRPARPAEPRIGHYGVLVVPPCGGPLCSAQVSEGGRSFRAEVDLSALRLADSLAAFARKGQIQLLVAGELRPGAHGLLLRPLRLEGVTPPPEPGGAVAAPSRPRLRRRAPPPAPPAEQPRWLRL